LMAEKGTAAPVGGFSCHGLARSSRPKPCPRACSATLGS
jgi:hypothetical protein